jgi:hypothetical protein
LNLIFWDKICQFLFIFLIENKMPVCLLFDLILEI